MQKIFYYSIFTAALVMQTFTGLRVDSAFARMKRVTPDVMPRHLRGLPPKRRHRKFKF